MAALARRMLVRDGRFGLLFHGISSHRLEEIAPEAQPHLTSDDLGRVLRWLSRRFDFLTPAQYLDAGTPGVLLTFDDGFANNYHNALPVLRHFNAPGLFFVSTQHVAEPRDWLGFVRVQVERGWGSVEAVQEDVARDLYDGMSVDELRAFSSDPLVTVGSHGVTHAILPECTEEQLVFELSESKRFLENVTGNTVDLLAYPRGDYDSRVIRHSEAAGYVAGFTIDPIGVGIGRLELPRVGIYRADPPYLSVKMSGLHRRPLATRHS